MQNLNLQIDDDVFHTLVQRAHSVGLSIDTYVAAVLREAVFKDGSQNKEIHIDEECDDTVFSEKVKNFEEALDDLGLDRKDVAIWAGVSASTVSRALKGIQKSLVYKRVKENWAETVNEVVISVFTKYIEQELEDKLKCYGENKDLLVLLFMHHCYYIERRLGQKLECAKDLNTLLHRADDAILQLLEAREQLGHFDILTWDQKLIDIWLDISSTKS